MDATIVYSVGKDGVNRVDDVATVQVLLNRVRAQWRVPPADQLDVDGIVGPKTIAAITGFQTHFVKDIKTVDRRVDPHGPTLKKLNLLGGYLPPLNDGVSYLTPPSAPKFLA